MAVLIACGGTGGHMTPGIALGERIEKDRPDWEVVYVFSGKPIEKMFLPGLRSRSITLEEIRASGLKGLLGSAVRVIKGMAVLVGFFLRENVGLVIGFGSATSLVTVLTGLLFLKPCVILEQNARMGRANRVAALFARRVYLALPLEGRFARKKERIMGNPLREAVVAAKKRSREEALKELGLEKSRRTILVLGGSQGALSINRAVLDNLDNMLKELPDIQFIHIAGSRLYKELADAYSKKNARFRLFDFQKDMGTVYRASDCALCRAGASTIAEIAFFGIPSILVPYPYACDDHQKWNARHVSLSGGAMVIDDADLADSALFMGRLKDLLGDEKKKKEMARAVTQALPQDAAENIVKDLRTLI